MLTPAGLAIADEDDPLAPSRRTWPALIGYARVSASGQNLGRQARALTEAGCIPIFAGKQPGKTAGRPELAACLGCAAAAPGSGPCTRCTTTPGGRLVFHVFAALAEFVRGLIVEGFALS